MTPNPGGRYLMRTFILTIAALTLVAPDSDAGWVTVKNDTGKIIYLQEPQPEGLLPGFLQRRNRPTRMLPGETYNEFQANPGEKSLDVYDAAAPAKPVHKAILKWGPSDVTFVLSAEPDKSGDAKWAFAAPKPAAVGTDPVVRAKAEEKK